MTPRLLAFFVGLAVVLTLLVTYVVRRVARASGLGPRGHNVALGVALVAVLLPILARLGGWTARNIAGGMVAQVGFAVGLTILISAGMLIPLDVTRLIGRGLSRAWAALTRDRSAKAPIGPVETAAPLEVVAPPAPPELGRRAFLERAYVGTAVALGSGTSVYGIAIGRRDYVLEQVPIPVRGLPRSLDGYTIVQLSDLHVGTFVGEHELAAALDHARSARPDLIVLTGDLVDNDGRYAEQLGRFARQLGSLGARDGVVAIAGNHDYYAGIDDVLGALRRAGADVLRNQGRVIGDRGGSFSLLGVDDVWAERNGYGTRTDLAAALRTLGEEGERDRARILLCHNPEYFPEASAHVDLQLSGHTHGGQVNFLIRPADLVLPHGYIAGHYHRGASQIYVNRGFGTAGPPARVGSPPEISRIVLTSA